MNRDHIKIQQYNSIERTLNMQDTRYQFHIPNLNARTMERVIYSIQKLPGLTHQQLALEDRMGNLPLQNKDVSELCRQLAEDGFCSIFYEGVSLEGQYNGYPIRIQVTIPRYTVKVTVPSGNGEIAGKIKMHILQNLKRQRRWKMNWK